MKTIRSRFKAGWLVLILCSASALTAAATSSHWLPWGKRLFDMEAAKADNEHTPPRDGHSHAGGELHTHDEEEGSGHAHAAGESDNHAGHSHTATDNDHTSPTHTDHEHSDETSLQLSQQAQNNIGVKLQEVRFVPFAKTIRVPATIVTRPGRSRIQVATPLTGTVSRIHHIRGEAVAPDTPLFEIRLTDKETIAAEADFLRMAKELDVVNREVERVRKVAAGGAIAGKALLARQYEQQKLEAQLESQRQRLLLQRLTPEQIDTILGEGQLLHEFTVKATRSPSKRLDDNELFQIEELSVEPGQHVEAGDTLCTLADHRDLHIEGRAFEHDIPNMSQAVRNGWMVTAVFPLPEGKVEEIAGLSIHYLANKIDRQSRTFLFYVLLPNDSP